MDKQEKRKYEELKLIVHDEAHDYCDTCQQLGNEQFAGIKTHRNIPLSVFNVNGHHPDWDGDDRWVKLCNDCILDNRELGAQICNPDGMTNWEPTGISFRRSANE